MAAVVLRADAPPDWRPRLFAALADCGLAPAALPRFLRVVDALPKTATHKYVARGLARDGFDGGLADPLFVRDAQNATYAPLDAAQRAKVEAGDF